MRSPFLTAMLMASAASARLCTYIDRYHNQTLPPKDISAGIDCVILAFTNSTYPINMDNPDQWYNLAEIKSNFNPGTEYFLTFGTWGDSSGFEQASKTSQSRQTYAKNVAKILDDQGFDGVDIDWEYPGGHGANYKTHDNPNELKQEITNFPLFLQALKSSINDKKLSIAVPGKAEDMMAYNKQTAKSIFDTVDYVNIMSYDLTNRRSKATGHLSSVKGSLESAKNYIDIGLDPKKANLGFPFYAEFYKMQPNCPNANGLNCPIVAAENADGSDAKTSGVLTFQKENFAKPPSHISVSAEGRCGYLAGMSCQTGYCCSIDGWCGNTPDYCGMSCIPGYGKCTGVTAVDSFKKAYSKKQLDKEGGGYYAVDTENNYFWTWDEPEIYEDKFNEIVKKLNLGGVMAWSLGQDSNDWSHIKKMIELSNKEFGGQSGPQSCPQSSPQSSPQSDTQPSPQSSPQPSPQSGSQSTPQSSPQSSPQSDPQSSPQSGPQLISQSSPQSSPHSNPQPGSPKECSCPE